MHIYCAVTQSQSAVVGTFSLVANVLLADKILGEKKSARDAYGITVIVIGSLLALYGDTVNTKNTDATIPQFLEVLHALDSLENHGPFFLKFYSHDVHLCTLP